MGGESVDMVELDARGIAGDRWFAVQDAQGRLASGKTTRRFQRRDAIFGYRASTTAGGVRVTGPSGSWQVGEAALDAELSAVMGAVVRVAPESGVPHQDAGSVSLVGSATLAWCAQRLGVDADPRRLRVNIVFESDEPFVEESWIGRTVRIGRAQLTVAAAIERCRMIDLPQDGAPAERRWLAPLARSRDSRVAMYADVAVPGPIWVGDAVWPPSPA
jgi:uncharacterized protein YcbX